MKNNNTPSLDKIKKKSILRWEAFVPALIIISSVIAYFFFLFDHHLRKGLEWAGYNGLGAEFNVGVVHTSFLNASINIKDIQATNPEKPTHNIFAISDIKFAMSWDALLRGKILIQEATLEQIAYDNLRKSPGQVKPPEPPDPNDDKPSFIETEGQKLAKEGLEKAKSEYDDNVLGDIAALLSGANGDSQLKELESQLQSKKKMTEIQSLLNTKTTEWNQKFKTLPQEKEFKIISDNFGKIKTKNFKTPEELKSSLDQANVLIKELEIKSNEIKKVTDNLNGDLKNINQQVKAVESLIQADIKMLETHFKLPKIDASSITKSLLNRYAGPYLSKFYFYKNKVYKYVPPGLLTKSNTDKTENNIQPHPRAKGISYEFGKPNSYPLFWLRKALISSKYLPEHPESGNLKGELLDITSNSKQTSKPMIIRFSGEFPGMNVHDILFEITLIHHLAPAQEQFTAKIGSYPVDPKIFLKNQDVEFGIQKAMGSSAISANFTGKHWKFNIDNQYSKIDYITQAKNSTLDEVLKRVFSNIPKLTIEARGEGDLPNIPITIKSNLGEEMSSQLQLILNEKISEAQAKVKKIVDEQISKEKQKIDQQITQLKTQFEAEITKLNNQVNAQKSDFQTKSDLAKKDFEEQANKAKSQAEKEIKKQLGPDVNKKIDDLKKKLKF